MNRTAVVVDVGSSKISVLACSRGVNNTINIKAFDETNYSGFQDGEFFEPEKVVLAVKKGMMTVARLLKSDIEQVYVTVPGEFSTSVTRDTGIAFRQMRKVTAIDIDDLYRGADVFADNRDYVVTDRTAIAFSVDDGYRTMHPVGVSCEKLAAKLCFTLAERKYTAFLEKVLRGMGVGEVKFLSAVLAEGRYLFDEEQRTTAQVLVDVGFITGTVALVKGDGLLFSKTFPMGGGHVTADLCECLHLSYEDAEALKEKVSLDLEVFGEEKYTLEGGKGQLCSIVHQIIFDRLDLFVKWIQKCLASCGVEDCRSIGLTGGGLTYLKGARGYLARQLACEVEVLSPGIPAVGKPEMSSAYAAADAVLGGEVKRGFWQRILKGF